MLNFVEKFIPDSKKNPKKIVFSEALDIRVLEAARFLCDRRLAIPLLLGIPSEIRDFAAKNKISTQGIKIQHPLHQSEFDRFAKELTHLDQDKNLSRLDAGDLLRDPLNMGMWMVRSGSVDICIAGNLGKTAEILRAAIRFTGLKPGHKTVSGGYLMLSPDDQKLLYLADCIVTPRPTPEQSAEIAIHTSEMFFKLTNTIPKVAMLSFSTRRSAEHEMSDKVRDAVLLAQKKRPSLILDGEVQFDAAIVPEIALRKAPDCRLQGQANVLVFPSLNAADIGRQILKMLGGYTAIGPFLQGLNGTVITLPNICSTEDIINVALAASGL